VRFLVLLVVLGSCTAAAPEARRSPQPTTATGETTPAPVELPVVATVSGPTAMEDATYLDGLRLGVRRVNGGGGIDGRRARLRVVDDRGDPAEARRALREVLVAATAPVVFVIGPGEPVAALRTEVERRGTPVIVLGGDLYTSRSLFRQAFQTSAPLRWQAGILARYLLVDRRYQRVMLVTGRESPTGTEAAIEAAFAEEGGAVAGHVPLGGDPQPASEAASGADAVLFVGGAEGAGDLAARLGSETGAPQLALTSPGLAEAAGGALGPGTVTVATYAWAGWAQPIARVARFTRYAKRVLDHSPEGFEQEGHDAVRLVASALEATGGRGGAALVGALEETRNVSFSHLPITLGPDDHLLAERSLQGLFAVAGPGEDAEPWVPRWTPWRPLMRTFTLLGERTSVLDRHKAVFFPGWAPKEPAPFYWQSRYGITSRPGNDPLH
jgi:branched-chain amino acid transport system substrate-binding protein